MTHTISGIVTSLVSLATADNPTYIQPSSTLQAGLYALPAHSDWTIANAGDILGAVGGIAAELASAGTVANTGTIAGAYSGSGSRGIVLDAGGAVTNSGTIGGFRAISAIYAASIANYGVIAGNLTAANGRGIVLAGGTITNASSGIVQGYRAIASAAALTLANAGTIAGNGSASGGVAIQLNGVSSITNQSHGVVSGYYGIRGSNAAVTVTNAGTIAGNGSASGGVAIQLNGAGSITNQSHGVVSGDYGIRGSNAAVTVTNAGTIAGTGFAVRLAAGFANRVIVDPGAVFSGTVSGGNTIGATAVSTLELASGASAGTLSSFGSRYTDFELVAIDAGATWNLSDSTDTFASGISVANAGAIVGLKGSVGTMSANGGSGGTGIAVAGGTLSNGATVLGGAGGHGGFAGGGIGGSGGSGGAGVSVSAGGSVSNSGAITGGLAGDGYYNPGGTGGTGLFISVDGTASNSGAIAGGTGGFSIFGNGGAGGTGVSLSVGGTLSNSGLIGGGAGGDEVGGSSAGAGGAGVAVSGGGTLINTGAITGGRASRGIGGAGVSLSGASLVNLGTIAGGYGRSGGGVGVSVSGGTLIDGGAILGSGSANAVDFGTGAGRLILEAGASFSGRVVGASTVTNVLELASSAVAGTVSGIGSEFLGFSQIVIDSGASWTLGGANTIAAGVTLTANNATLTDTGVLENDGVILIDPSTVVLGSLTGTGSVTIAAGSTLEVQGSISSTETIVFAGANASLHLDSPTNAHGIVQGFGSTDTIDLTGVDPTSVTFASGQLGFGGGIYSFSLSTTNNIPVYATTSADGTDLTPLCFLPGTLIRTPTGEVQVQDLQLGDLVTTLGGAVRPIAWIGMGQVLATRGKRGPATPVIVRKNAIAPNVPFQDLRVTKGHSFLLDGVLIPAEFLVNHRSIAWDDRAQEVALFHVELETHDILIANGAPAESYRDDGNRWLFRNANSGWDQPAKAPCVPVLTGGPIVDAVWRRLLDRAGPRPGLPMTDDPDLHIVLNGRRIDGRKAPGNWHVFNLPKSDADIRIRSRSVCPAEAGTARDPRMLGVAIREIRTVAGATLRLAAASEASFGLGFHAYEADNGYCWTDGDAELPAALVAGIGGAFTLEIAVGGTMRYPVVAEAA